jgi:transcriptional regulator with XRE-family HTH domain
MENLESIRGQIRTRRKQLGLRQADLAKAARVSLPTISALEQGRIRELGFSKITRILAALRLELRLHEANRGRPTLDDLREEADENEPEIEAGHD